MIVQMTGDHIEQVLADITPQHLAEWSKTHLLGDQDSFFDLLQYELMRRRSPHRYACLVDGEAVVVGGVDLLCAGVGQTWAVASNNVGAGIHEYTRFSRKLFSKFFESGLCRIQSITMADDYETHRWYRLMGLT